jgi:uncharacterized coiled-coil protein SlyX
MPEQDPVALSPAALEAEVARLRALVAEQATRIAHLRERIQELEARLAKDSHNSSKPLASGEGRPPADCQALCPAAGACRDCKPTGAHKDGR